MVLSFIVQRRLTRKFDKYSKIENSSNMTGAEIAGKMLRDNGIFDVTVKATSGSLTDFYDPRSKTVNLSESVYGSSSIAAAAVAAHECGHAVQHAKGYGPLKFRTALIPVVNFASKWVQWVLLAGVVLVETLPMVLWFGIGLFAMTTLFSLVTLPVELNASHRAVDWLEAKRVASYETKPMAVDALKWAAYTYVISAIGSLATLFYYLSLANRR